MRRDGRGAGPGRAVAAAVLTALTAVGCGGADDGRGPVLTVWAATSLAGVVDACAAAALPGVRVRVSLGATDQLAARIDAGLRPDVFVAADLRVARRLADDGRLKRPVAPAANEVVAAVGASSPLRRLSQLGDRGVTVALARPEVPVGAAGRALIGRLSVGRRRAVLANVRTEEPDARGVVGKLRQGAVDAGLVYRTDVRASRGALRALPAPGGAGPRVVYGAGVVRGADHPREAERLVAALRSGACRAVLRERGFGVPRERGR